MKTMKACTRYFVLILALMMLFMAFATVAGAADGEEATAEAAQADSSAAAESCSPTVLSNMMKVHKASNGEAAHFTTP